MRRLIYPLALAALLAGCDDEDAPAPPERPVAPESTYVVDVDSTDESEQWYYCRNVCTASGSYLTCEEVCEPISEPPE